jgi:hypothetical protein
MEYNSYLHSEVIKTIVSTELLNWFKIDINLDSVKCICRLLCINIYILGMATITRLAILRFDYSLSFDKI